MISLICIFFFDEKKIVFKDMNINLDPGDTLLYYSIGAVDVKTEDKKQKLPKNPKTR